MSELIEVPKDALTVMNPFATMLVTGIKKEELRAKRTTFRGRLLITSSQRPAKGHQILPDPCLDGHFVGMVFLFHVYDYLNLKDYQDRFKSHRAKDAFWKLGYNRGWEIKEPVRFEKPVKASGARWIWKVTDEDRARIAEANPELFQPVVV